MNRPYRIPLALLLALLLLLCGPALAEAPAPTPEAEPAPEVEPEATPRPANGYVRVTAGNQMGWLPLPDEGEYTVPVKLVQPDGTQTENLVHLTPEGVYMEDSTCENHDCVDQGEVTLENKRDRILGNMIICLPNQVMLELFTPDEVLALFKGAPAEEQQASPGP